MLRTALVVATLLAFTAPHASAQANGGPPYIEPLPGGAGSLHTVLVRFPSPVIDGPERACTTLNYNAGAKYWGEDQNGRLLWVICAWRE